MNKRHYEKTDDLTRNSVAISLKNGTLVQQKNNEESKQMNSEQIENNETVPFYTSSKRKLKCYSMSDETSNRAQSINSPDTLLLSSSLKTSANEVYFDKSASYKGSSENIKIDNRFESGFPRLYERKLNTSGFISEQNEDGSNVSSMVHEASDEKSEISIKESKCHSFNKGKKNFAESIDVAIGDAHLISKNISKSLNSHIKPNFSSGKKESDEASGEIIRSISQDAASRVRSKNEYMAVNMMENQDISENANDVAGPSGVQPYLLKQAEKMKFACGLCHKEFEGSWEFDIHYRTHTGDKPFVCEICEKRFTQKRLLAKHYRTHTSEKLFVCDVCKRRFFQKGDLDKHYRTHTGEKPFECELCKGRFTQKSNLDKHFRTHTGEKHFVCEICKRRFTHKGDLDKHYRTHTGEKPFVCDLCNKGFSDRSNLARHAQNHRGDKLYKCSVCDKSFTRKNNLNTHCKEKHK